MREQQQAVDQSVQRVCVCETIASGTSRVDASTRNTKAAYIGSVLSHSTIHATHHIAVLPHSHAQRNQSCLRFPGWIGMGVSKLHRRQLVLFSSIHQVHLSCLTESTRSHDLDRLLSVCLLLAG